jgi:hypothetical protein
MEVVCSSETSVDIQRTTWRYIPEASTLHNYLCENLKSYRFLCFIDCCLIDLLILILLLYFCEGAYLNTDHVYVKLFDVL